MPAALNLSPVVAGVMRLQEWQLTVPERVRWIEQALELGITGFDHADIYGEYAVEALFGEALAAARGLRERLTLVTKCGIRRVSPARPAHRVNHYDSSASHIVSSVENSLRALRTDRIDLLLLHRPDMLAEPDAIAAAFEELELAGKVLHFGVSNHSPRQFEMLHRRFALATHQFEFSPLQMKALADGTLEQCVDLGLRPMLWAPLAGGRVLTSGDEQARRVREVLVELGHAHGVAQETVAYAWLMGHPAAPIPVTGTRRIEGLKAAVAACAVRLSAEDWYHLWVASMGHGVA